MVKAIETLLITVSASIAAIHHHFSFLSLCNLSSSTFLSGFFFTMIQGGTGEKSGWTGYLQPTMVKKSGVM